MERQHRRLPPPPPLLRQLTRTLPQDLRSRNGTRVRGGVDTVQQRVADRLLPAGAENAHVTRTGRFPHRRERVEGMYTGEWR